ncbi:MAG TPA: hypothetical protein VK932_27910 [Kofleriaceae bacterium]|nr:hypothetical protein [Kofleriaceae bacterium]
MVAAPVRREPVIDVVPAELGDPASVERMRHRVRMKRIGRAWLRHDGVPLDDGDGDGDDEAESIDEVVPAIGETANRIRVVTEEDGARVAVWIERRDAWATLVAPVALDVGPGGAVSAGVWLEAGAPIALGATRGRAAREIDLRDDAVEVRGRVPAAFLGHVWIVPHDDQTPAEMTGPCGRRAWRPRLDTWEGLWLDEGRVIRAAPKEGAPVLAILREAREVEVVARRAGWAEVELQRPYARIRGHVPEGALDEIFTVGSLRGSCGGRGFGMSHADRIEVPAGTCLFDRADGEVIGVATEARTRLGARARSGEPWSMVYVDTRWRIASLYVRDVGRDPARPVLDSCAPDRHRR